jgi:osomolarity two-component system sensor histidine kinase TcsA
MSEHPLSSPKDGAEFDYATFIDSVIDYAIIGLDASGNVATWNTGAARLKGYEAKEIIGRHFSNFYSQGDRDSGLPASLLEQAESLGHIEHTGWRVRKDGTRFWGDVIISAVRNADGQLIGFTKVTRDLTERRLAEERERNLAAELERANRMKSAFLANMSHEIRTPLNGVIGMLTLALDGDLRVEQRELIETAHNSSRALLRIVNDILDFSKVEAGRLELESEPFSVREVIQEVCDLFEPQAQAKSISLLITTDSQLPPSVLGDAGRLRQVLANLVGNAVKFTDSGSVQIIASTSRSEQDSVAVHLRVVDSGVGIAEADQQRLFEAFTQADLSTTRRFGGTGLGLAISQQLVDLMGGSLYVRSEVGRGSTFGFELQFRLQSALATVSDSERIETVDISESAPTGARGRVLLAEDNEVNQQVASLFLRRLGFDPYVVANGQEAVEALTEQDFDVVLMDCQMPVLDGYEATRRIRNMQGSKATIPIVAVTASAMPEERRKCFEAGMTDFISKPLFATTLNESLTKAMARDRGETRSGAYAESLYAAMGGNMARLIDVYAESAELQLETIVRSLRTGDSETAARAAHTLKGGSSALAVDEMTDYATRIEAAIHDNRTPAAIDLCREAIHVQANVIAQLRRR